MFIDWVDSSAVLWADSQPLTWQDEATIVTSQQLSNVSISLGLNALETTVVGASAKTMQLPGVLGAGSYQKTLSNGTGNSQGNTLCSITGTITAGTPVTIDLDNLNNSQGTMSQIKSLLIQETSSANGNNYLLVGDSTGILTNATTIFWTLPTGQIKIGSMGASVLHNPLGYGIVPGDTILQLSCNIGTVTFQLDAIGVQ